ncbi:MAG: UDP-glucose 4-epimerase GalE [Flavobacteriales bacterium]
MKEQKYVIVTGGTGFIGSHAVVQLIDQGFTPVVIDDFRNSKRWILDRLKTITGQPILHHEVNCANEAEVLEVFSKYERIEAVMHFAAYKSVGESVAQPLMYFQNNINSLAAILKAMKADEVEHLIFSSSCTVYGSPSMPEVTERTPIVKSESPYGETKIICERLIEFECRANPKLKATLLRYFNPIGAHPSALIGELPEGVPNNLVPYITQAASGKRDKLTVFGDDYNTEDGSCLRDYIHVVDLARAHSSALQWSLTQPQGFCEAINLGTGEPTSVLGIIKAFEEETGVKLNYTIGPRRPGDVEKIWANAAKANELLGWTCKYSVRDALAHAWKWECGGF